MPLKPKILKYEYLIETLTVILTLHYFQKFFSQINDYLNFPKAKVNHIVY